MPDKDDKENIDRMFSEIMSSNSIEGLKEEQQEETILDVKSLIVIQESLMDTLLLINSLIYKSYATNEIQKSKELEDLLSSLYQSSEDLYVHLNDAGDIIDKIQVTFIEDDDEEDEED